MITESIAKSSVTVDTASRGDLSLQGVHFTHMYQPTLSATCTVFQGARQSVVDHDLYLVQPYPRDNPKQGPSANREVATSWRHLFL